MEKAGRRKELNAYDANAERGGGGHLRPDQSGMNRDRSHSRSHSGRPGVGRKHTGASGDVSEVRNMPLST